MIVGIGIDSVEIHRFASWYLYQPQQLLKIFSEPELAYSLSNPLKRAERLAARFAVKEALFKALCQMTPGHGIPFFTLCKLTNLHSAPFSAPALIIDWDTLNQTSQVPLSATPTSLVSITHTSSLATAIVLLENDK